MIYSSRERSKQGGSIWKLSRSAVSSCRNDAGRRNKLDRLRVQEKHYYTTIILDSRTRVAKPNLDVFYEDIYIDYMYLYTALCIYVYICVCMDLYVYFRALAPQSSEVVATARME